MRKNQLFFPVALLFFASSLSAQENTDKKTNILIPYATILYGGCVSVPFSFIAGIQQVKQKHFSILYDVHYWNTNYECYCDDTYSKGHYTSFTPSVKFIYNTGKKTANGFFAGAGLGYMIAKDRGTEQTYTKDPVTDQITIGKDIVNGKWDFNSISPSLTFGLGFRLFHFPVAISNTYYVAKTTEGWEAAAGGVGFKMGFKKIAEKN